MSIHIRYSLYLEILKLVIWFIFICSEEIIIKENNVLINVFFNQNLSEALTISEYYGNVFKIISHFVDMVQNKCNGVMPNWRQPSDYSLNGHVGAVLKRSKKAMVTGGGGYFGYSLGCALAKSGVTVTLFDVQKPKWKIPNGVVFFQVSWSFIFYSSDVKISVTFLCTLAILIAQFHKQNSYKQY